MKKLYILFFASLLAFNANSQASFCDDFETYTNGEIDTNEWVIIGDSLYINGIVPVSYMQEVSDTNLILVAAFTSNLDWHTLTLNGTRD